MTEHLDENVIASLFERRVSATVIAAIDAHVASCDACRDLLATYAQLFERGGTLGPTVATPPPGTGTKLLGEDGPPPMTPSILEWIDRHGPKQRVGKVLRDKWTLDALLGSGGMGHVFAATHRNGRRGAVKMLRAELAANPDVVERFVREGYVANRIGHPGTVAILDDDCAEDGAPFLVMELLEGESVGERLHREGRIAVKDVLAIADQVLDVLTAAHPQRIVHRDIKPDNLFVTREGRLKVLDFGIARILELSSGGARTQAGMAMGTPQFMPPEQARGEWDDVDGRTDLWALGATMYACVTGISVRDAETPNLALLMAMTEPVRKVGDVAPWVPRATAQVIDRALAMDRGERFQSAEEMQRAIRHATRTDGTAEPGAMSSAFESVAPADPDVLARRLGFERSPSRMPVGVVGALAGLVGIVVVIGVVVSTLGHGSDDPPRVAATAEPSFSASGSASADPQPQSPAPVVMQGPETEPAASSVQPKVAAAPSATMRVRGPSRPPSVPTSTKPTAVLAPTTPPSTKPTAGDDINPLDVRR
jgi:serine/threonine-protein kinase